MTSAGGVTAGECGALCGGLTACALAAAGIAANKAATAVGTFGAGASSSKAGNAASLNWSLTDDPAYATGTYAATATFTISAA